MTEVAWHRPWWRWRVRNIDAVRGGLWWIKFTNPTKLSKYIYCNWFLSDIWPVHDGIFFIQEHRCYYCTRRAGTEKETVKDCLRYQPDKNVSVLKLVANGKLCARAYIMYPLLSPKSHTHARIHTCIYIYIYPVIIMSSAVLGLQRESGSYSAWCTWSRYEQQYNSREGFHVATSPGNEILSSVLAI